MSRSVDALEGLGLLGRAAVGPLSFPTPALLVPETGPAPGDAGTLALAQLPSPESGTRCFRLGTPPASLDLRFEVPTPDLSSGPVPVRVDGRVAFVHGPLDAGARAVLAELAPELVVLSNARTLFLEGRAFVEALRDLRAAAGPRPALWAPRVATPGRVAMLVYLGVDLLDATQALLDANEGRVADPELGTVDAADGFYPIAELADAPARSAHALRLLAAELDRARAALRGGRLRELVEARLTSEPRLAELLRYADERLAVPLDERAPVTGGPTRAYVLRESFRRPEVRRYRRRFVERYRPPPVRDVLLLVPCSKTKPYRNSRSHRRFARAWEGLPSSERLHVVSVTSPLGLVPRELEDLPPARHYDIPVTGDWDEAERAAVTDALRALRDRGAYRRVLVHLDPSEYAFLRPALEGGPEPVWTVPDERVGSDEAIAALRAAAASALEADPGRDRGTLAYVREDLRSLAAVQFGPGAAERLLADPIRLHGRPWFQRISDGHGTDLATWREERGLFHLTAAGGRRLGPEAGLSVEIGEGVDLHGDVFSPGVVRADEGIRVGDAAVLVRDREVLGVGEAVLPGPLMAALGHGLAVRVRHRSAPAISSDASLAPDALEPAGRSSSG